ncbi:MAG: hypothetical protein ABJ275_02120 [Maricaulaceae bacterium]
MSRVDNGGENPPIDGNLKSPINEIDGYKIKTPKKNIRSLF